MRLRNKRRRPSESRRHRTDPLIGESNVLVNPLLVKPNSTERASLYLPSEAILISSKPSLADHCVNMVSRDGHHRTDRARVRGRRYFNSLLASDSIKIMSRTFTIRGMSKITSGPTFLRFLWFMFMCLMCIIMLVAIILIVKEYLLYEVTDSLRFERDGKSPFPAITVCHQHPFSHLAYELWNNGSVPSPSEFSQRMRDKSLELLYKSAEDAHKYYFFDMISIYYQSLRYEDTEKLGFQPASFLQCISKQGRMVHMDEDCTRVENFRFRRIANHQYFNCYTFEPTNMVIANDTDMISLIIDLGPEPDYTKHELAFILDLFDVARGLKVVIHEPGSYPDLAESLNVEPGKMNEITYQPVLWKLLDRPTDRCFSSKETFNFEKNDEIFKQDPTDMSYTYAFSELGSPYTYSRTKCLDVEMQKHIVDKCACQYIYYPRRYFPSNVPNCGDPQIIEEKSSCVSALYAEEGQRMQEAILEKSCRRRCRYYSYESSISITQWSAADWQLFWLRRVDKAFKKVENDQSTADEKREGYKYLEDYFSSKNLSKIPANTTDSLKLRGTNFASVKLVRKPTGLKIHTQKLALNVYVILSRVGGVCGLTFGLSFAFFAELIEFCYVIYHGGSKLTDLQDRQESQPQTEKDFEALANSNGKHTPPANDLNRTNSPSRVAILSISNV